MVSVAAHFSHVQLARFVHGHASDLLDLLANRSAFGLQIRLQFSGSLFQISDPLLAGFQFLLALTNLLQLAVQRFFALFRAGLRGLDVRQGGLHLAVECMAALGGSLLSLQLNGLTAGFGLRSGCRNHALRFLGGSRDGAGGEVLY